MERHPLPERRPKKTKKTDWSTWRNYLAISPANHPLQNQKDPTYRPLHLEAGTSMNRPGYIEISEVYSMDWRDARPYRRRRSGSLIPTRLDPLSMQLVLSSTAKLTGYSPKKQPEIQAPTVTSQTPNRSHSSAEVALRSSDAVTVSTTLDSAPTIDRANIAVPAGAEDSKFRIDTRGRDIFADERAPLLPLYHGGRPTTRNVNWCGFCRRVCQPVITVRMVVAVIACLCVLLLILGWTLDLHGKWA